ncbi:hypothetical protein PRUPE_4G274100 [Prunus persica]|uniref:Uncharacterized protein n=1 Tax=Prunus persica TaxID=3760 RepID=A0A251PRU5_PRUPE|nr:hypothetical protein PRUPE_4G274100 [Prunus persica]
MKKLKGGDQMNRAPGGSFICFISCFLFVSIVAGGGCLLMYMILPEPQTRGRYWLPIIGVALVCLPWVFWFLTFVYRLISRRSGSRFGVGNAGGAGGAKNINTAAAAGASVRAGTDAATPADKSSGGETGAMVAGEIELGSFKDGKRRVSSLSRTSSSINVSNHSNHSHESEMPLATSMAS